MSPPSICMRFAMPKSRNCICLESMSTPALSWRGPVVAIAGGEKYFGAVERRQPTANSEDETSAEPSVFAVGDCVLLAGGTSEVVHVLAMWESREGGVKRAEVRYFCNASAADRSLGRSGVTRAANEVSFARVAGRLRVVALS